MLGDLIVLRKADGHLLEEGSVPARGSGVPAIASGSWALAAPTIPIEASARGAAQHVPPSRDFGPRDGPDCRHGPTTATFTTVVHSHVRH